MRFVLRPARTDELDGLADELARAYVANLLTIPMPPDEAEALADMVLRQTVRTSAGSDQYIVRVIDDTQARQLVAAFVMTIVPQLKLAQGAYLWVKHDYRGQASLVRKMIRHADGLARERGARRIELGVLVSNDRLRRIYARLGYVVFGHLMVKRL